MIVAGSNTFSFLQQLCSSTESGTMESMSANLDVTEDLVPTLPQVKKLNPEIVLHEIPLPKEKELNRTSIKNNLRFFYLQLGDDLLDDMHNLIDTQNTKPLTWI